MTESHPNPWPRLMCAATAARYLDEPSVQTFRRRVGSVYPGPITGKGTRQKWDRDDLDQAIALMRGQPQMLLDAANVL